MSIISEKLFNQQVKECLSIYKDQIDDKWLYGNKGNIYAHLDILVFEKFNLKFGFLDINQCQPYLKYNAMETILLEHSTIKRIAYKNLVYGVVKEVRKLYKELDV